MENNNDNPRDEEVREETSEQVFDFWSDEGARLFNEILDEGSAYGLAHVRLSQDFDADVEDEPCEYVDPEEETLPPGELELIFENSYLM